jgi:hypothetical protein
MEEVAGSAPPISPSAQARIIRGEAMRRRWRHDIDRRAAGLRFAELIAGRADHPSGQDPTARA